MVKVRISGHAETGNYINYFERLELTVEEQEKMVTLFEDSMIQTLNSAATIRVGKHIIRPSKFISFTIEFEPVEEEDESEEDTSD